MTHEEFAAGLISLAKRMGLSIMEIDYMARRVAQVDVDPLPLLAQGERFDFSRRLVSAIDDPDDLSCFSPRVPKPDAGVDLLKAWEEFERDVENINRIFRDYPNLPMAKHWQLFLNGWDWFRFWSLRHPDPGARAKFAEGLRQADASAEYLADLANTRLRNQQPKRRQ